MENLIEIKNLTMAFRKQKALDDVALSVRRGEIYGLVGNNGAGKTTLLRILCRLLKPTEGEVEFAPEVNVRKIGTLIEKPGLYGDMTGYQNLKAKALAIGYQCKKEELLDLLELVGLGDVKRKMVSRYSMGMKQRLGIAMALVGEPELLLLDEPINGLDIQGINDIRNLLMKLHEERNITIIISSHILDELAKIATRLCVMKKGKIVLDESMENIAKSLSGTTIEEWYLKVNSEV